jgi:CPA1 family monovalent cation:H+ antiporter
MEFLLYLALVPALAFAAQWIAWRANLPSILLLLVIGVVLGQFIRPDAILAEISGGDESQTGPRLLFPFVSLAVAVIMFEGGMSLKLKELQESGAAALRLCTVGAGLTAIGSAIAAHYCLGFDWRMATLLGAILLVTGPTVIGPLMRQVKPSQRVANSLKWEGIVIDPVGAVAAVLVFEVLMLRGDEAGLVDALLLLGETVAVGAISGIIGGIALTYGIRRFLIPDHLHGIASFGGTLLMFAVSNHFAHESGLIAVTTFGVWMTNQKDLDVEHIVEFFEHLRTISIGCLFILLSSRVELTSLGPSIWRSGLFLVILILVVRPISVFVALVGSRLNFREQVFVASIAPRGIVAAAVSSIFALQVEQSNQLSLSGSDQLAGTTFLVIVTTVTVYGLAASPIARLLHLSQDTTNGVLIAGADEWVIGFATELKQAGCNVVMVDTNFRKVTRAKLAGINAFCANILNEHVRDELPMSNLGHMLAMTQNDEVNSLALREYQQVFGRANTYQLTIKTDTRRAMTKTSMARELFGPELTHSRLSQLCRSGMEFKATRLTEELSFQQLKEFYQEFYVLAIFAANQRLDVITVDEPTNPVAGDTVIALVRKKPELTEQSETQSESTKANA